MLQHVTEPNVVNKGRTPEQIVAELEPHIRVQALEMLCALLLAHTNGLTKSSKRGCAVSVDLLAIRNVLVQARAARDKAANPA